MKKQMTATTGMSAINKKVLEALGAKKQLVGKTMFKLPSHWEEALRQFAKISNLTIRDFLDSLAAIATRAHSAGTLPEVLSSTDGERKSYAISKEAKESFTKIARERGVSRDSVVQSALVYILKELEKNALSAQEKITYACTLADALDKMLAIYDSERVAEARKKLCATGDPDFADCEDKFSHIDELYALNFDHYIRRKENENNKTCN